MALCRSLIKSKRGGDAGSRLAPFLPWLGRQYPGSRSGTITSTYGKGIEQVFSPPMIKSRNIRIRRLRGRLFSNLLRNVSASCIMALALPVLPLLKSTMPGCLASRTRWIRGCASISFVMRLLISISSVAITCQRAFTSRFRSSASSEEADAIGTIIVCML